MEYGIYLSKVGQLPADPRSVCPAQWHDLLPPAPLRAIYFGSEFCQDLLPEPEAAERMCRWAGEAGVDPVLLTPMVTQGGHLLVERLLGGLASRGCFPAVVFNDWGVLRLLRNSYPGFRRRAGRLLNRGLRDPRLSGTGSSGANDNPQRLCGLRSLLIGFGVEGIETDADLDGTYLGEKVAGLQRVLHFPYVFAATGRNCLIKAEGASSADGCFTKGLGAGCSGLCRERWHQFQRQDTERVLWRSGNTIFYEVSMGVGEAHLAHSDRVVLYQRPAA